MRNRRAIRNLSVAEEDRCAVPLRVEFYPGVERAKARLDVCCVVLFRVEFDTQLDVPRLRFDEPGVATLKVARAGKIVK